MSTVTGYLKRTLIAAVCIILLLYVGALAYLFIRQEAMIFFPSPVSAENRDRYESFETRFEVKGQTLSGWFIPGDQDEVLIYYGGNATELSDRIEALLELGDYSLLLMNYRGYGDSTGSPGEQAMKQDALSIFDQAVERFGFRPEQVVLIGRSLGSGIAAHVAARRDTGGLVLVTPYDSISAVAGARYPVFPVSGLLRHPFNTLADVDRIEETTLIIKSETDDTIPHPHSDRLIRHWQSPHEVVTLPGTHGSVVDSDTFDSTIRGFIESL